MQVSPLKAPLDQVVADALVIGLYADEPPGGPAAELDRLSGGVLTRLVERSEISGKVYELIPLLGLTGVQAPYVLVLGLGKRSEMNRGLAYRTASAAARHLAGKRRSDVAFCLDDRWSPELTEAAVCGAVVGCQGQDLYRSEKKRHPFEELHWLGGDATSIDSGRILGESMNLTRRLVNEPPQEIYPATFAEQAVLMARECGIDAEVWDQQRLEAESAGSLLAVAKGSSRMPRLVILNYQGATSDAPLLALVGKGVTFDSGGLSIKPNDSMLTMKCDMAGAATVVGAMEAIARLKLPVNVIGLVGLVENMPGAAAMKLGDVLTARSGRTIEVHNTDAEGRLVLADVLDVAVERGATKIIDLATLTGACVVALGNDVAGLMSNHQPWCDTVAEACRACGEPAWQLPMFAEYGEQIKSEVADIKNVGEGRWGGAITAAKFLEEFVAGTPWVHFDIAGPAFLEKSKPWLDGGATGVFVRSLVEVARGWQASKPS
jgi:leucyl aminopeptidase